MFFHPGFKYLCYTNMIKRYCLISLSPIIALFILLYIPLRSPAANLIMNIILSPDKITLCADNMPGICDAQPVDIIVMSEYKHWSIHCEMDSSLTRVEKKNSIPPDRIYINTPYSSQKDQGAGAGYEALNQRRLVAQGSFTAPMAVRVSTLKLRLVTTWDDLPGTYTGHILFTYLTHP